MTASTWRPQAVSAASRFLTSLLKSPLVAGELAGIGQLVMDFAAQARSIEELTNRYAVEYIGIDATGIGQGVFQLVQQFFPAAREIRYSPEVKTALVLKVKDTISSGRLEYDTGHTDITASFMAIRKTMTASGNRSTYEASRSEEASHADVAWAIMHALLNEPLTAANGGQSPNILEFY